MHTPLQVLERPDKLTVGNVILLKSFYAARCQPNVSFMTEITIRSTRIFKGFINIQVVFLCLPPKPLILDNKNRNLEKIVLVKFLF